MIVRVEMAAWEVQCCRPEPATGQRAQWQLGWRQGRGPAATAPAWTVERAAPGWTLTLGGVAAYAHDEPDPDSPGTLVHTAHGGLPEELPTTAGTVRRVQVVEHTDRRHGVRAYVVDLRVP